MSFHAKTDKIDYDFYMKLSRDKEKERNLHNYIK